MIGWPLADAQLFASTESTGTVAGVLVLITFVIRSIIQIVIIAIVVLMILRLIVNFSDPNPFGFFARNTRRFSDPLVNPIRRFLSGAGADPKFAPIVVILVAVLGGFFAISLVSTVLTTIGGAIDALQTGSITAFVGYILYGLVSIYLLLIFIRIMFSWGMVSYGNPIMRFLVNTTDPLLVPLRRTIPPIGIIDISPIVAFLLLMLLQYAIHETLLR